jgi:hypothetical protein
LKGITAGLQIQMELNFQAGGAAGGLLTVFLTH